MANCVLGYVSALTLAEVGAVAACEGPLEATRATMDDAILVQRCLAGDGSAWEALVHRHSRPVYNLCFRFTGHSGDAEDLTQEVFLRVYRRLASFRPAEGTLLTWICAVTRNLLIDHYRRHRADRLTDSLEDQVPWDDPAASGAAALPSPAPAAEHGVWVHELEAEVQRALTQLSPELREAVILRDLQDLDYSEIGTVLGIPPGTVRSRIHRGRLDLARLLKPRLERRRKGGERP